MTVPTPIERLDKILRADWNWAMTVPNKEVQTWLGMIREEIVMTRDQLVASAGALRTMEWAVRRSAELGRGADPESEERLRHKCRWEHMSRTAVLLEWGDPAGWS